jgi:osmoprotectant transport system substrate-binding protein
LNDNLETKGGSPVRRKLKQGAIAAVAVFAMGLLVAACGSSSKKAKGPPTIGGAPEFATRFEGLVGLKQEYGLTNVKFKPLAIGLQYKALDDGQVQVADVFTTDGQLQGKKYTVLKDPKNVFGFQNVAPVVSKKAVTAEGPAFTQTLNAVSAKLTTPAMQQMNGAVDLDKNQPAAVAGKFLMANGLAVHATDGAGKPPVTIGGKNFTEQSVLAELYSQALQAKGYKVTVKLNIGSTEIIDKALTSGKIDLYPEYTGVLLTAVAHDTKRPASADAAYATAKAYEEQRGFTLLDKTAFANTDALAVKESYAKDNDLKEVGDLKKLK